MYNSISTQFPGGFTNAAPHQTMSEAGTPDPGWSQLYHHDFNNFVASDLTLSGQGAPTASLSSAFGSGGFLSLQTTTASNDEAAVQQPVGSFILTGGKHHFFKSRVSLSNAWNSSMLVGLASNNANPLAAADGLFIYKAPFSYGLSLRSVVGGVTTDTPMPAGCQMANGVLAEVGFHVDQQGNVEVFFNPTTGNNPPPAGSTRGRVAALQGQALTQAMLAVSAATVANSAGIGIQMALDYLTMSSER